jgi:ASC-1-like (ASCH) protein
VEVSALPSGGWLAEWVDELPTIDEDGTTPASLAVGGGRDNTFAFAQTAPAASPPVVAGELEQLLFRRFFDQIAAGTKRVLLYARHQVPPQITEGAELRLRCDDQSAAVTVTRVIEYANAADLLAAEGPDNVDPGVSAEQQLTRLRAEWGHVEPATVLALRLERA